MSQTNYLEWVRTAKNADFVTAMSNSGFDQPIRVADLTATLNGECELEFRCAGGIAPSPKAEPETLWLCGSLETSRMPLFVHRYLVGVFTKKASRGGRKGPCFLQARLLVGRNPALPGQPPLSEADSLTIHEMEVPAKMIVGGNLPKGLLDRFRKAVIDLRATGGRPSDAEPGNVMAYRLHVRFANSPAAMRETTAEVHVKTSQGTMKIPVPKTVQSFDVMWTSADPLGCQSQCRFLPWCAASVGQQQAMTPDPKYKLDNADSLEVIIPACNGSSGELWADVSLLHRVVPSGWKLGEESYDEFTFNWLSAPPGDRLPDRGVRATTSTEHFEAQGRFVSSSPSIAIENR